jgi:hypothetical protein
VARPGLEDEERITSESDFAASLNPALVDRDMDSSESAVRRTLKAFDQKRAVAYLGRMSVRIASLLPRLFPRPLIARIAGNATAKMGLDDC